MMRSKQILNHSLSTLKKEDNKEIKDSKHSPVYRKRGVEGFTPLFSFFFVNLSKVQTNMKLYLKIFVLLIALVSFSHQLDAQADVKSIVNYVDFDEDNAVIGDSTNITIFCKFISAATNADTAVFGNVFFRYQTNWMWEVNHDWREIIDNNPAWTSYPAGINQFNCRFYCNPSPDVCRTGPVNVIIIWPALTSNTFHLVDSADYFLPNVDITTPMGIENQHIDYGSNVFPNPIAPMQVVYISSKYSSDIASISIYNSLGQIMNSKEFGVGENASGYVLPTNDLQAGIYHLHIRYQDKKTEVVKFIKN